MCVDYSIGYIDPPNFVSLLGAQLITRATHTLLIECRVVIHSNFF